jgi:DNA topoisomerase-1
MKYLVIVESPAKCKKIEKYLNDNDDINIYTVVATMGHITELKSLKNIDIENFTCKYDLIEAKIKNTENIRKKIKETDEVILACDNDREGESINYYICITFNLPLTTKRIIFNEITESALVNALKTPLQINMNLVHAQQARQILDMLVGFKITPMLWNFISKKVDHSLSAGRCQTPALKLIYENQQDINNTKEQKVYHTVGCFTNSNLPFVLNKEISGNEDIIHFLDGSKSFNHIYTCSNPLQTFKHPPEPFTTSRIQQTASNELHCSPKETMKICQSLYEGGYITYMRTDSKKYSQEFLESTKQYIMNNYSPGEKYLHDKFSELIITSEKDNEQNENQQNEKEDKSKKQGKKTNKKIESTLTQEAHEAIRPTNISLFELPETINSRERRMYKLIWTNTLESCMSPAIFNSVTASISGFENTKFSYTSELIHFPGWKIVEKKYSLENKEYHYLQTIKQDVIPCKKVISTVILKNTKHHYTEARLVQLLEEKGIGRPSTFSTLIEKIQERGYVKKEDIKGKKLICKDYELYNGNIHEIENEREFGNEKNKLVLQQLGVVVMEFLEKHFCSLFNYDYTREMENNLDKISKGTSSLVELCSKCNTHLDVLIEGSINETKLAIKIDDHHTYIIGKHGPVIKCIENIDGKDEVTFKSIKKEIDVHKIEKGEYTLEEMIETNAKTFYNLGSYQGNDVILKKGKFGLYISWGENSKTIKELGNRPIENITFEDIKPFLCSGSNLIREVSPSITIRKGPKGDYIFYKTGKMKKPKFYDLNSFKETNENYKICDLAILKSWIKEKYNIF